MDRRNAFDVVCRGLGLWQVLYGIDDFASYLNVISKLYDPVREAPNALLILSLSHLLPGLFLLFSASTVVNMVYGAHAARGFPIEDAAAGDEDEGDQ